MAKYKQRTLALEMRKKGASYSQIKEKIKVSKSTLSLWLRDMPLSQSRIRKLRDNSEQRIENFRETMKVKREKRLTSVYENFSQDIGALSDREFLIAGLFLYWGEGTKADRYMVMFTNTDPAMVKCFIKWMYLFGVKHSELKVYLHLYSDMNILKSIRFWSKELAIPKSSFRKPYIKETSQNKRKNYKGRFGHGTCNVYIRKRDVREKIAAGIAHFRALYGGIAFDASKAI